MAEKPISTGRESVQTESWRATIVWLDQPAAGDLRTGAFTDWRKLICKCEWKQKSGLGSTQLHFAELQRHCGIVEIGSTGTWRPSGDISLAPNATGTRTRIIETSCQNFSPCKWRVISELSLPQGILLLSFIKSKLPTDIGLLFSATVKGGELYV